MTIVEELKKLIVSKGGSISGISTIGQAVKMLTDLENADNPLSALTIDATIDVTTDLLGKVVTDLQSNVVVGANKVTGTLEYVDDYTGFSGLPAEQEGHYLVLHASVPDVTGATITIKASNKAGEKELDDDGILVKRVDDKNATITFTAKKSGYPDFAKTFDLSALVLQPET